MKGFLVKATLTPGGREERRERREVRVVEGRYKRESGREEMVRERERCRRPAGKPRDVGDQ